MVLIIRKHVFVLPWPYIVLLSILLAANSPSVTFQSFGESASRSGEAAGYEEDEQDENDRSPLSRLLIQNESEFYKVMLAQVQAVIKQQDEEEEEEEGFSSVHRHESSSPPLFTPSHGLSSSTRALGASEEVARGKHGAMEYNIHLRNGSLRRDIEPGRSTCSLPSMWKEESSRAVNGHCISNMPGEHGQRTISRGGAFSGNHECNVDIDDRSHIFPTPPYSAKKCCSNGHDSRQAPIGKHQLHSTGHSPYKDSSQLLKDENKRLNMANCAPHDPLGLPLDDGVDSNCSHTVLSLPRSRHKENKCTDGLYQQCLADMSLLSLPPSGVNTMLLTAGLWGLDYSMDENVHQADLIGMKYLHGMPSAATGGGGNYCGCGRPASNGAELPTTGE